MTVNCTEASSSLKCKTLISFFESICAHPRKSFCSDVWVWCWSQSTPGCVQAILNWEMTDSVSSFLIKCVVWKGRGSGLECFKVLDQCFPAAQQALPNWWFSLCSRVHPHHCSVHPALLAATSLEEATISTNIVPLQLMHEPKHIWTL